MNFKKMLFENAEARKGKYRELGVEQKKIKDNILKKTRVISEAEKLSGKIKNLRAAYEKELAESGVNRQLFKTIRENEDDLAMLEDTARGAEALDLKLNENVKRLQEEVKFFDEQELAIELLELSEPYESLAASLALVLQTMQAKIVELCLDNNSFAVQHEKMPFEFAASPLLTIPKLFTKSKWSGQGMPSGKAERFHFIPIDVFNRAVNVGIPTMKKELGIHPKQELSEVTND
jgi:hypothetical protein